MKIKPIHAARSLCGVFLAACLAEITIDTGPAICAIDPTCRKMTAGEIALARPLFGDSIRYEDVLIFNRPTLFDFFDKQKIAQSLRNNVYLRPEMGPGRYDFGFANTPSPQGMSVEDDHAGDFTHELAHVWKYQRSGLDRHEEDRNYSYQLDKHESFLSFNSEQQAEIVKHYFNERRMTTNFISYARSANMDGAYAHQKVTGYCRNLAPYEAKLKQVLPLQPLPVCQKLSMS